MSDTKPVVYYGSNNNGTYTLLTEGAAKAITTITSAVSDSQFEWDDFWSVYTMGAPSGIATFCDVSDGVTGTRDDLNALTQEVLDAGGQVLQMPVGHFVPHSNNDPNEPPSVTMHEFRRKLGLSVTDIERGEIREAVVESV